MFYLLPSQNEAARIALRQWTDRIGSLGIVVLLHVAFFQILQSGLRQAPIPVLPFKEIIATLIPAVSPAPQMPASAPVEVPHPKPTPLQKPHKPIVKPLDQSTAPLHPSQPTPKQVEQPSPSPANDIAPSVASNTPAPPATPPVPRTVDTGIECPQLPAPDYPPLSRRMGEEGKVVLRILVNDQGRIEQAEIRQSSGFPRLDEAARRAVLRAVCKPYMDQGKAVPIYALQPISFRLDN